ncbi:uncharacterized protein DUF1127 [Breoghania corrubedonensis]|uniref:Uncharacterized protein DUF1127 n=1 Tax=Breoghania corrubedonensis TaxID=665038 RepID=A0A2T5VF53_9HYPH|nr:DUF1127 domain-containing protein [Breoghania corrubedonensis]PTW62385.1 uncharacterized protein DUF1127 [Breoghania corrubedonensis]
MSLTVYDNRRSLSTLLSAGARGAFRIVGSFALTLFQAHRARRSLRVLVAQEDYMLRDIGVTRADLYAALSAPNTKDPSSVLARLAGERQKAERARRKAVARNRRATT